LERDQLFSGIREFSSRNCRGSLIEIYHLLFSRLGVGLEGLEIFLLSPLPVPLLRKGLLLLSRGLLLALELGNSQLNRWGTCSSPTSPGWWRRGKIWGWDGVGGTDGSLLLWPPSFL
jgi:hypothetical protein